MKRYLFNDIYLSGVNAALFLISWIRISTHSYVDAFN